MNRDAEPPTVRYEARAAVAWVTIDRPEVANALSWQTFAELRECIGVARDDPGIRALVLAGAGDTSFCSGADLGAVTQLDDNDRYVVLRSMIDLLEDLWTLGIPTIARVQGHALAAGFGLALACDLVVASERAVFGAPEAKVGLWPFLITVPMLRAMTPKRALELMLTGRTLDAHEADQLGLVTRVVAHEELDRHVEELAAMLASRSPAVTRLGRDSFYAVCDRPADEAFPVLRAMLTLAMDTSDPERRIGRFLDGHREA